jgi:hypothetical protein
VGKGRMTEGSGPWLRMCGRWVRLPVIRSTVTAGRPNPVETQYGMAT